MDYLLVECLIPFEFEHQKLNPFKRESSGWRSNHWGSYRGRRCVFCRPYVIITHSTVPVFTAHTTHFTMYMCHHYTHHCTSVHCTVMTHNTFHNTHITRSTLPLHRNMSPLYWWLQDKSTHWGCQRGKSCKD